LNSVRKGKETREGKRGGEKSMCLQKKRRDRDQYFSIIGGGTDTFKIQNRKCEKRQIQVEWLPDRGHRNGGKTNLNVVNTTQKG